MSIKDEDLANAVTRELDASVSWMDGELSQQQSDNLKYYFREPFGNELSGHSQIVTADVMETIEGIMPELMKIFTSGENVVEFNPVGAEDADKAKQATDYLNHIFLRRMDGFKLLYDWFKDSLLMKNGIIRVGWEEDDEVTFYNFKDVTEEDIKTLEEEETVEEIEIEETEEEGTFDVRVKRVITGGSPFVETIPSEDFFIKERSKSIVDSAFHAYVTERTVGEMLQEGFSEGDLTGADSGGSRETGQHLVEDARFSDPSEGSVVNNVPTTLVGDATIKVITAYIKAYDETDRVTKLMRVIQVGDKVLEKEEVNRSEFISLSPIMMPHKFTGVSVADLVRDVQEINSSLWRQMLDNLALQNAGRYAVQEGQANLQDLLDNKIGGVVRMKVQGAVQRLDTPQLSSFTVEALDRLQDKKELRVGVSKMTAGLDPNALNSHTAATAVNQVMTAAQQKILLIARIFAETGVKDLFRYLYEEVRLHATKPDVVKLRGEFVEVSPFDWIDRKDMTVTVGIGNGNKDQQLLHLQNIGQMLQTIGGTDAAYLIDPTNVYNYASEVITNAGFKNVDAFIRNPALVPPPPDTPSPEVILAQAEAEKDRSQAQLNQTKAQTELQNAQNKAAELQLNREKFEWQKRIEAAELNVEAVQGRPVGIGDG